MLKYLLVTIIIVIIIYFLSILKQKRFIEPFDNGFRVNVLGASALEKVVSTVFDTEEKQIDINVNNTLGEDQRLVHDASHDIASDDLTFSDNCPIYLSCSEPPTKNEQAILDVYRNNLRREPDNLGFHYWLGRMKKGDTIESISQVFKESQEYKQVLEGKDKHKFEELNSLNITESIKEETFNKCAANFDELMPCCGNPITDLSVEEKYICPEEKPICSNYIVDKNWGTCMPNGGNGNKAIVLGAYNMHPWNLTDKWLDKKAKWIWFEKNADRVTGGSTMGKFEYKYYKKPGPIDKSMNYNAINDLIGEIHICVDNYAYVYLNGEYLFTQTGGWPNSGIHKDIKIKNGVNHFEVIVINASIRPNPAGLIMSIIGLDPINIISTNEDWSYTPLLPKPETILLDYRKPIVNQPPKLFNPLIALWNTKHKGFLRMDVDTSVNQYTASGKLSLMNLNEKKLPNSYRTEGAIFKFSRTQQWMDDDTYSLYNCRNSRFIRTNGDTWEIDTAHLNANQDLIEDWDWGRWTPVYNADNTVSFKSAIWKDRYLSIHANRNIISKILDKPDESSKWEVLNIDTVYLGPSNELQQNEDKKPGFVLNIPKYIAHLGQYPINIQFYKEIFDEHSRMYSTEQVWNDSIMNYSLTNINDDWNVSTLFRTDKINGDIGWDQPLQLFGIKSNDLKIIIPEFEVISTGTSKEIVLTNDKILCIGSNNVPYYRELYNSQEISAWTPFNNPGVGTSLIVGEVDNEPCVFMIGMGDYTYVYYRKLSDLTKGKWEQYNNSIKDLQKISFDKTEKHIIGLNKNGEIFVIKSRTTQVKTISRSSITTLVKTTLPVNFIEFNILDKKIGTMLLLIDKDGHLHGCELSKTSSEIPVMLENNLQIKKVNSVNNMIFAIDKNDGRLYFKPMSKIIPFRLYNSKLEGDLIDIQIYKDELYVVSSQLKVMRCQIILS